MFDSEISGSITITQCYFLHFEKYIDLKILEILNRAKNVQDK